MLGKTFSLLDEMHYPVKQDSKFFDSR